MLTWSDSWLVAPTDNWYGQSTLLCYLVYVSLFVIDQLSDVCPVFVSFQPKNG